MTDDEKLDHILSELKELFGKLIKKVESPKLKLELGKVYKNRYGETVLIIKELYTGKFKGLLNDNYDNFHTYKEDGSNFYNAQEYDIIEELPEKDITNWWID